jgi:hypothetical protein
LHGTERKEIPLLFEDISSLTANFSDQIISPQASKLMVAISPK